jgi:hypothetical protein
MSDNTVPTNTAPINIVPANTAATNTAPTSAASGNAALTGDEPLRASDAERDTALHLLAAHYADGRLERAEFDERADAALAARTRDQLRVLFADLPGPRPVPVPASTTTVTSTLDPRQAAAAYARRRAAIAPGAPPILRILVPLLLVFTVLGALHGAPPIPLIPLLFILTRRHRRWNREARPWT